MSIKAPREQSLVKPCLQLLALRGVMAFRNNVGAVSATYKGKSRFVRFGTPGSSDILGIVAHGPHRGRFLALELKVGKNPLTELQAKFLATIRDAGGIGLVARSVTELDSLLTAALESTP